MKTLLSFCWILVLLLMAGCKSNEAAVSPSFTGKWQLTKVEFSYSGRVLSGDSLPYQEVYTFNADFTFTHYRSTSGETTGTYTSQEDKVNQYKVIELFTAQSLNPDPNFHSIHRAQGLFYFYESQPDVLILKIPEAGLLEYYKKL